MAAQGSGTIERLRELSRSLDDSEGPDRAEVEEELRTILDLCPDPVSIATRERDVLVNRALLDCLGWSEEEFFRMGRQRLIHPDDWPRVERALIDLRDREVRGFQCRSLRKNGSYVQIEWRATTYNTSGRTYAFGKVVS